MKLRILASSLLAICTAGSAFAGTHALLPPQQGDMVPSVLLVKTSANGISPMAQPASQVHVERKPLSVSWPLPHDAPLQSVPVPFARDSREYWTDVSASELQQGIKLPLSAPGAIIRLSPSDSSGGRLQPANVRIQLGRQSLTVDHAASQIADTQSLRAAGMDVPEASMVVRLNPELGAGMATLQAPAASGRYVVHVFEPLSPFTVTALGDRGDLLVGHGVHVRVAMHDGDRSVPLSAVGGFMRAPDGNTTLLEFQRQTDGSFTVDARPNAIPSTAGLWEVHSFTVGTDAAGNEVRRDTTTVFAAATPDARLSGTAETMRARDHGIDITLGVTALSASRYAVTGVLFGHDASGRLVPAAFAQSAAWLPIGDSRLLLHYDATSLAGITAPYELHDLRLQDQPAIGLLEHRALAMRIETL